jgi:transposase-like protein
VLGEYRVVEQRYDAVMEVLRDGLAVTEVAERWGISRQSLHAWINRYAAGGLEALADRSHRPRHCPHQTTAQTQARICELRRRHPDWGRGGCTTSWAATGWTQCRRGRRSIGRWSATG